MSHPNPSQESSYPEDGVTHYPSKNKHKSVADIHKKQMGHMMNLLQKHAKSKALRAKMGKKEKGSFT